MIIKNYLKQGVKFFQLWATISIHVWAAWIFPDW